MLLGAALCCCCLQEQLALLVVMLRPLKHMVLAGASRQPPCTAFPPQISVLLSACRMYDYRPPGRAFISSCLRAGGRKRVSTLRCKQMPHFWTLYRSQAMQRMAPAVLACYLESITASGSCSVA
jgi:hypothetical protein